MSEKSNYAIKKHIAALSKPEGRNSNWNMEINLVSWYNKDAKFDLREWSPDHGRCGKGITLTHQQAMDLRDALNEYFGG